MYIKQGHRQKETYVKMQTETAIYKPKNLGIRINQFCKHYEFFKLSEFRTMRKQIFFLNYVFSGTMTAMARAYTYTHVCRDICI